MVLERLGLVQSEFNNISVVRLPATRGFKDRLGECVRDIAKNLVPEPDIREIQIIDLADLCLDSRIDGFCRLAEKSLLRNPKGLPFVDAYAHILLMIA